SGTNTYAEEGTYPLSVTVNDVAGAATTVSGTVNVADAPLTATGRTIAAQQGADYSGTVATFTDGNPSSTEDEFTATIAWGDGHTSAGTVTANGQGGFDVAGTHTYEEEGFYALTVQVTSAAGTTTLDLSFYAADAPLTATLADSIDLVEGQAFSGLVASFADA